MILCFSPSTSEKGKTRSLRSKNLPALASPPPAPPVIIAGVTQPAIAPSRRRRMH